MQIIFQFGIQGFFFEHEWLEFTLDFCVGHFYDGCFSHWFFLNLQCTWLRLSKTGMPQFPLPILSILQTVLNWLAISNCKTAFPQTPSLWDSDTALLPMRGIFSYFQLTLNIIYLTCVLHTVLGRMLFILIFSLFAHLTLESCFTFLLGVHPFCWSLPFRKGWTKRFNIKFIMSILILMH